MLRPEILGLRPEILGLRDVVVVFTVPALRRSHAIVSIGETFCLVYTGCLITVLKLIKAEVQLAKWSIPLKYV